MGLLFLVDKANGGDATAEELARRFRLLGLESRNVVDFYFLGWDGGDEEGTALVFDLNGFTESRNAFRDAGVRSFGSDADLILCDAHFDQGMVTIDSRKERNRAHFRLVLAIYHQGV